MLSCDVCRKPIEDNFYTLSVSKEYKYRVYYCCSKECLQKALIKEDIGIPEIPKTKRERRIPICRKKVKDIKILKITFAVCVFIYTVLLLIHLG